MVGWLRRMFDGRPDRPRTVEEAAAFLIANHHYTDCVRMVGEKPDGWADDWDSLACRRHFAMDVGLARWHRNVRGPGRNRTLLTACGSADPDAACIPIAREIRRQPLTARAAKPHDGLNPLKKNNDSGPDSD
ncbi:MAG TPA: hypothetical protein VKD90_21575 [Gemmataceae bacterium]|nr:hypothetical protein [Gemmataceae bacterium]